MRVFTLRISTRGTNRAGYRATVRWRPDATILCHTVCRVIIMRNLTLLVILASLLLRLNQSWVGLDASLCVHWLRLLLRWSRLAWSYIDVILRWRLRLPWGDIDVVLWRWLGLPLSNVVVFSWRGLRLRLPWCSTGVFLWRWLRLPWSNTDLILWH